jgi:hypothetical protein
MVTEVREQPEKAALLISVTEEGMVTEVREEQQQNALRPIYATEDGMVTFVREVQPQKASW